MRGRPLRFLAIVLTGWTAARVAMLWPDRTIVAPRIVSPRNPGTTLRSPVMPVVRSMAAREDAPVSAAMRKPGPSAPPAPLHGRADPNLVLLALVSFPGFSVARRDLDPITTATAPPPFPAQQAPIPNRWMGSVWLIARDGDAGNLSSPLLGGTQAGARLTYSPARVRGAAAFVRVAAPLSHGATDLALGGQWRPGRAPVTVYGELRRNGGRIAPASGAFGGGGVALAGFRLEGYGQAGVIARRGAFGDGQARLTRSLGGADLGVGLWGAAQRGATRIDVGPTLTVALPSAGKLNLRLLLDWRQRIAGNARPASGPALSLGADF